MTKFNKIYQIRRVSNSDLSLEVRLSNSKVSHFFVENPSGDKKERQ